MHQYRISSQSLHELGIVRPSPRCPYRLSRGSVHSKRAHPLQPSPEELHNLHCHSAEGHHQPLTRSVALRLALGALVGLSIPSGVLSPAPSSAALQSQTCEEAATLTFKNESKTKTFKVYWINYDGDPELYVYVLPTDSWTVDSYVSHPWRVVDNETGAVLQEVTASSGYQVVKMTGKESPLTPEPRTFSGFDGLGGAESDYKEAKIETVVLGYDAGFVVLKVPENRYPISIPVAASQMMILIQAAEELRRPTGLAAWQTSLKAAGAQVQRVLLTRVVPPLFYARIVVELPGGTVVSVDAQPGDSMALARRIGCPIYVSNELSRVMDDAMDDRKSGLSGLLGPAGLDPKLRKGPRVPGQPEPTLILPPQQGFPDVGSGMQRSRELADA